MFLGHYGLAFGAKKAAPRVSLLILFVAVEFVDILWPFMLLFDVEQVKVHPGISEVTPFEFVHYPYTHSLLMGLVWGVLFGLCYWLLKKDVRSSVVVGLAVLSHWFLDFVVHIPDLPLTPFGSQKVGLGLWNSLPLTLLIESIIFFGGIYIYVKNTTALNAKGKWGLWALVIFFIVANLYNVFGPPPSDSIPVLFVSFAVLQVIVLALAHFVEKNREGVSILGKS
ncbi:metal-dependent hydrolase [Dyadobacter sp. CY323]|uniref:metal-dependent hydrolase n=1 Tax=Dyadobacter sp. CY323 TaxID=2907302 RepID=UPI001F335A81|nr:metal-dependent hydrolase [Dyadobacter sp. CY323]MCE6989947.1 hypothetical protein [Dyadobacter sp. CY323]